METEKNLILFFKLIDSISNKIDWKHVVAARQGGKIDSNIDYDSRYYKLSLYAGT